MNSIRIPEETHKTVYFISQNTDLPPHINDSLSDIHVQLTHKSTIAETLNSLANDIKITSNIIIDWDFPHDEIRAFVNEIKSTPKWRHISIIMLTSNINDSQLKQGIDMGIIYYLDKNHLETALKPVLSKTVKDFNYYLYYIEKIKNARLSSLAQSGTFRLRTFKECYEVADWLANLDLYERDDIVVGFIELLINAVEHGNLNIGYDEKTDMLKSGNYVEQIIQKLEESENKEKVVTVEYQKYDDKVVVTIQDEGKGFDFKKYMSIDKSRLFDSHGRGIIISKEMYFSEMQYLNNGNTVKVSARLAKI